MSTIETPGRSLVTRRAIIDIVRDTTLNSYGVTGFAASRVERLLGRLGFRMIGFWQAIAPATPEAGLTSPTNVHWMIAWHSEDALQRGVEGPTPRLIAGPGDRFWDVLAWRLAADR